MTQSKDSALDGVMPEQAIGTQVSRAWDPGDVLGQGITVPHVGSMAIAQRVTALQQEADELLAEGNKLRTEISTLRNLVASLERDLEEAEADLIREQKEHNAEVKDLKGAIWVEKEDNQKLSATISQLKRDLTASQGTMSLIAAVVENHRKLVSE